MYNTYKTNPKINNKRLNTTVELLEELQMTSNKSKEVQLLADKSGEGSEEQGPVT